MNKKNVIYISVITILLFLLTISITNIYALKKEIKKMELQITENVIDKNGNNSNDQNDKVQNGKESQGKEELNQDKNGEVLIDTGKDIANGQQIHLERYRSVTDEEQKLFSFSKVKITSNKKVSTIKGEIQNLLCEKSNIVITIEFYKNKKKTGAVSEPIKSLKKGLKKEFEMTIMSELVTDNYKIYVQYIEK